MLGTTLDAGGAAVEPTQYYLATRSTLLTRGEYRLLVAALEDAVACWEWWIEHGAPPAPVTAEDLVAWFEDEDETRLFSFRSICMHLDLAPEAVLARLRGLARPS